MNQKKQKEKETQPAKKNTETLLTEPPKDKKTSNPWGIIGAILTAAATLIAILNGIIDFEANVKEVRATFTPLPSATLTVTPVPTHTPLFTPGPLTFIELPKEIRAGSDVKVIVQAWQGATCYLEYFTADGNPSQAEGLGVTTPDGLGRCTWVWRINANTHEGLGKVIVHVGEFEEEHSLEILPEN